MATALAVAVAIAAEPTPTLLGSTRDQVIRRMGEPRSQLAAGNRVVMLYPRERIVLRDGVVVEVDRTAAEPLRRIPPAAPQSPTASGAETPATGTPASASPGSAAVAPAAPAPPSAPPSAAPTNASLENAQSPSPDSASAPSPAPKVEPGAPPPSEPKLEIKLIRPPSSGSPRTQTRIQPPESIPSAAPIPSSPKPSPPPSVPALAPAVSAPEGETPTLKTASGAAAPNPVATSDRSSKIAPQAREAPAPQIRSEPPARSVEVAPAAEEPDKGELEKARATEKKAKVIKAARRRLEAALESAPPDSTPSIFSTRTVLLAIFTVCGGVGYLVWRRRQRRLDLEASAVSQTPFTPPADSSDGGGAQFSANLLSKLEWKRFEELVEAYYSKTGVVAARTKGGPSSPAQIKISWKGEPRPFALVRCLSRAHELVEIKPLHELYTALAAEDIRRGYVVTSGKFSVAARDYAEEKHLTLLPGEIFLEKLNALPAPARSEIMQTASSGDYSTPSCPTCDSKMAQSSDNPPVWRCSSHPNFTLPVGD